MKKVHWGVQLFEFACAPGEVNYSEQFTQLIPEEVTCEKCLEKMGRYTPSVSINQHEGSLDGRRTTSGTRSKT